MLIDGHWERMTYEALDDPEYIPGEMGRITWVVKGVNGTPEKPNKKTVLRSPSVFIGGYYWNIKYFPRGDEGTNYMSVFIECSTTPQEDTSTEEIKTAVPIQDKTDNRESPPAQATEEPATSTNPSDSAATLAAAGASSPPGASAIPPVDYERWDVAAQVGCVVYNPEEPRVHASQTSSHHFYQDYPDYGWIRFHGPWNEIHKRQRLQRQALLRNDTLVFTAYIRTVIDHTLALWWHAPKDTYRWDCLGRTGLRQITTGILNSSALISAIMAWLHLRTNTELILNMHIPDPVEEPKSRPRPLFLALQQFTSDYYDKRTPSDPEASLDGVIKAMDWYGAELDSKMDVVAIWENLRRILNYEASDAVNVADAKDLFREIIMLRQPDPWKEEQPIVGDLDSHGLNGPQYSREPHSVQEAFNLAITGASNIPGVRHGSGEELELVEIPSVLQVELHRQSYDKKLRQWRKLAHQIKIDPKIIYTSPITGQKLEYTLNSVIVHSGDLESQNYSAVIRRPQSKNARWVRFAGEQEEKGVEYLTQKQAITSHEGIGENATGDASVAYITSYERNDSVLWPLLTPLGNLNGTGHGETARAPVKESSEPGSIQKESTIEQQRDARVLSVHAYPSTSFIGHAGRGFLDIRPKLGQGVFEFKMSAATTVSDVINEIIDRVRSANKSENPPQAHVYALDLDIGTGQYARGSPGLVSQTSEQLGDCTLGTFAHNYKGCHFWLHDTPAEDKLASPTEVRHDAAHTNIGSSSSDEAQASELEAPTNTVNESLISDGQQSQQASQSSSLAPENEDTVMDGVPEPPAANPIDVPVTAQSSSQTSEEDEKEDYTYVFVKTFNHLDQTLVGKGSFYIPTGAKVKETIQKLLGPNYASAIDVYREHRLTLSVGDSIKSNWTFSDLDIRDGEIFIAQRPPSAAEYVSPFPTCDNNILLTTLFPQDRKPRNLRQMRYPNSLL